MEEVEVTTDGNSLIKAVYQSRLRLTRLLLEGGAYINESNDRGETPLMIACKTKHVDTQSVSKIKMIKYLVENNADPNIQDKFGKTALMHACIENAGSEIVSLLLKCGADPSIQDHSGFSALVYAVNSEDKETLKVLLNACKARGKEVIIITTDKSASGRQTTKQYLNVPPSPEACHTPGPCTSPSDIELNTSPVPNSTTPENEKELFSFKDITGDILGDSKGSSEPGSPTRRHAPAHIGATFPQLQRLHSEPWLKIPASLLHQHKVQSLQEELQDITPEEEMSLKMNSLGFSKRYFTRHQSIDVKDTAQLLKAFDHAGPRKLSYDEIHSNSLDLDGNQNKGEIPVDQDPDSMHATMAISSLSSIIQRRRLGANHYSSDSQLTTSRGPSASEDSKSLLEKKKMLSPPSLLSNSRESLENVPLGALARRNPAVLERRGSGALLLDHIAQTRPGFLPPLNVNPHPPIPDITTHNKITGTLSSGVKPFLPTAPSFPKEFKSKKMLLRRHSMHTEQIKQLVNYEETIS